MIQWPDKKFLIHWCLRLLFVHMIQWPDKKFLIHFCPLLYEEDGVHFLSNTIFLQRHGMCFCCSEVVLKDVDINTHFIWPSAGWRKRTWRPSLAVWRTCSRTWKPS